MRLNQKVPERSGGWVSGLWPQDPKRKRGGRGGLLSGLPSGALWGLAQVCPCFSSRNPPRVGGGAEVRPVFDRMAVPTWWPRSQGAWEGARSESLSLSSCQLCGGRGGAAVLSLLGLFPHTGPLTAWRGWTAPLSLSLSLSFAVSLFLFVSCLCLLLSLSVSLPPGDSKGNH